MSKAFTKESDDVEEDELEGAEPLPTGKVSVRYEFTADHPGTPGTGGRGRLLVNGQPVGENHLANTVPLRFTSYSGLDIGKDNGDPASTSYAAKSPFAFTGKLGQVVFDQPVGQVGESQAGAHGVQGEVGVVRAHRGRQAQRHLATARAAQRQAFQLDVARHDGRHARQVGRRLGCAGAVQVGGRGDEVEGHPAQRPGDQRGRGLLRGAQREVVAIGRQVHLAVGQVHVDQHLGVLCAVVGQHPRDARRGTPHGRAHLELAARRGVAAADGTLGRIEQVERAGALLVPGRAGLGQAQVPAGAVQQPGAQGVLQFGHMLAGHRRRQRQPIRRRREAAGLHDFAEHPQAGHAIHEAFSTGISALHSARWFSSQVCA